jgi:hypothetical protein
MRLICQLQSWCEKSGFKSYNPLQILGHMYFLNQPLIKNHSPTFPFLCKIQFLKFDPFFMTQAKRNQWPIPKLISMTIFKDLILKKLVIFFFIGGLTSIYKRDNTNQKKKVRELSHVDIRH